MLSESLVVPATIPAVGMASAVVSPIRIGANAYLGKLAIFSSGLTSLSEYTKRVFFDLSFLVFSSGLSSAGVAGVADVASAGGAASAPGGGTCPMCICCSWNELTCGAPKLGRWGRLGATGRPGAAGRLPDRGNPEACGELFWGCCGWGCEGKGEGVVP